MFELTEKSALGHRCRFRGLGRPSLEAFARAGARVFVTDVQILPRWPKRRIASQRWAARRCHSRSTCATRLRAPRSAVRPGRSTSSSTTPVSATSVTALTTTGADLDRLYAVNVRWMLNVTRVYLPDMVAKHKGADRQHGFGRRPGRHSGSPRLRDDEVRRRGDDKVHGARSRGVSESGSTASVQDGWRRHGSLRGSRSIPIPKRHTARWRRRRRWVAWGRRKRLLLLRSISRATRRRSSRDRRSRSTEDGRVSVRRRRRRLGNFRQLALHPSRISISAPPGHSLRSSQPLEQQGIRDGRDPLPWLRHRPERHDLQRHRRRPAQAIPIYRSRPDSRRRRAKSAHRQSIRSVVSRHAGLEGGQLGLHDHRRPSRDAA